MANEYGRYGFWPTSPNPRITYYPVAASQTFTTGDAVILSSGLVAIGVAASAALLGVAAGPCASLDANTMVPVYDDPQEFFMAMGDGDVSALGAGSEADLTGATGAMMVDADASSTDVFKIIRHVAGDTNSSAGSRMIVKINKHLLAEID